MLPGQQIAKRIIRLDPGAKSATLHSRSATPTADAYTDYAWTVIEMPENQRVLMSGNVQSITTNRVWTFLRESQTVLPKPPDRVTIEGVTWNLGTITNIRWDGYGFDAMCVRDAA